MRAAFSMSYLALTGAARRLFRLLGLALVPHITVPVAAAVGAAHAHLNVALGQTFPGELEVSRGPDRGQDKSSEHS
jgi:hypothetical protein